MKLALLNRGLIDLALGIVFKGDSRLIIQFMTGGARPGKPYLLHKVKECKRLSKEFQCRVYWHFVPREENRIADWLARQATEV